MYPLRVSNQKAGAAAEIQIETYSQVLNTVQYCTVFSGLCCQKISSREKVTGGDLDSKDNNTEVRGVRLRNENTKK